MAGVKRINGTTPIWPTNKDQRNSAGESGRNTSNDDKQESGESETDKDVGNEKLPPEGQGGNIDEFV